MTDKPPPGAFCGFCAGVTEDGIVRTGTRVPAVGYGRVDRTPMCEAHLKLDAGKVETVAAALQRERWAYEVRGDRQRLGEVDSELRRLGVKTPNPPGIA